MANQQIHFKVYPRLRDETPFLVTDIRLSQNGWLGFKWDIEYGDNVLQICEIASSAIEESEYLGPMETEPFLRAIRNRSYSFEIGDRHPLEPTVEDGKLMDAFEAAKVAAKAAGEHQLYEALRAVNLLWLVGGLSRHEELVEPLVSEIRGAVAEVAKRDWPYGVPEPPGR